MANKKRSRAGIINYINKLFKGDIQDSYDNYDKEKLATLYARKSYSRKIR